MGMLVINIFACWQGHTQSMRCRLAALSFNLPNVSRR